jgi:N-acetylglutamate synthase-like GNAT family acetyltransferase
MRNSQSVERAIGLTELKPFWSSKRTVRSRDLSSTVQYRRGKLHDLKSLKFEDGLPITAESMEFNVLGMGHEFWVAVQAGVITALAVLAQEDDDNIRILHLEMAPSRKNEGFGSALLKAVTKECSQCRLSVIPFDGAEGFYEHLGFTRVSRWEMRR